MVIRLKIYDAWLFMVTIDILFLVYHVLVSNVNLSQGLNTPYVIYHISVPARWFHQYTHSYSNPQATETWTFCFLVVYLAEVHCIIDKPQDRFVNMDELQSSMDK